MLKKLEAIVGAIGCATEEFKTSIGPLRGTLSEDEAIALFKGVSGFSGGRQGLSA